ncbi:transforming growth factor-beta-induced protein ig-h3-like [Artemia franciscana]|uniref:transforming growth factor-beta-induced protein ig-h3-like n=1 Tax=Artemia franciscana TaxID=6661 RepID=UPI0032DB55B8
MINSLVKDVPDRWKFVDDLTIVESCFRNLISDPMNILNEIGIPQAHPAQPGQVQQRGEPVQPKSATPKNIPGVATDLGASTLVDLVIKAGLADALSGPGPFTVFAPTNDAFAALPKPTLDALGQNTVLLKKVLLYHVVQGEVPSTLLPMTLQRQIFKVLKFVLTFTEMLQTLKVTLRVLFLRIRKRNWAITADGAQVIKPDVRASNGIIRVVDRVLYPIPETAIPSVLINDPQQRFTTLVTAVKEADLVETLQADGPYTLCAPTNDAFNALPAGTLDGLLKDKVALRNVLLGHVVPGTIFAKVSLLPGLYLPLEVAPKSASECLLRYIMTSRQDMVVNRVPNDTKVSSGVSVNDANVIQADLPATNGVIHVINKVI